MLAPLLALATLLTPPCPMVIGITHTGAAYTNRFQGWFRASDKLLESDLAGGCYNDSHPVPVGSVRLVIAPHAPQARIDAMYKLLQKNGWQRSRVTVEPWPNDTKPPR